MEWSIQVVARMTGTTSRTLRHYDDVGLLPPTRIGANGTRHYDRDALTRLQRILLLRELGLGLPAIAEVLARQTEPVTALRAHLDLLRAERARIGRQQRAIERTIAAIETGEELTMTEMFDGFDHTAHREEVEGRWGADAYATSAAWWEAKSPAEREDWQRRQRALAEEWASLAAAGADPAGEAAQALAARHAEWLAGIPGTPANDPATRDAYLLGLGELYVADARFAANYGGEAGAAFVRDALAAYVRGGAEPRD